MTLEVELGEVMVASEVLTGRRMLEGDRSSLLAHANATLISGLSSEVTFIGRFSDRYTHGNEGGKVGGKEGGEY